jgi:RHS repeat-associated protein
VYVDALVARDARDPNTGGLLGRLYAVQDANWNVTAVVDGMAGSPTLGQEVERYAYDPYGAVTVIHLLGPSTNWAYLHQGGRYDAQAGLYDFRNRAYSPALGRWLQNDPLGFDAGDTNLYRAEGNNPVSTLDFTGLATCGPDVSDWFFAEAKLFYNSAKGDTSLKWFKHLARLADYKMRHLDIKGKKYECWNFQKLCPKADKASASLCGTCLATNQLGNLIFGVIARATGRILESYWYGMGFLYDSGLSSTKPSDDWRAKPEKAAIYRVGLTVGGLVAAGAKNATQMCAVIKDKLAKSGAALPDHKLCKISYKGPNTDLKRDPLVDEGGNVPKMGK